MTAVAVYWILRVQAVTGAIQTVMGMIIMPLVQPHWWREKFGGRPLLVWTSIIGFGVFKPFVCVLAQVHGQTDYDTEWHDDYKQA